MLMLGVKWLGRNIENRLYTVALSHDLNIYVKLELTYQDNL